MFKSAKIVNFIYMVFCLHIQWLLHVVKGFIIAGIFPSTAAVYAVIRDLLLKKEIDSLSNTFSIIIVITLKWLISLAGYFLHYPELLSSTSCIFRIIRNLFGYLCME